MKNCLSHQREHPPGTEIIQPGVAQEYTGHHDIDVTEGGECLDDSIHMKDQPLIESVEATVKIK